MARAAPGGGPWINGRSLMRSKRYVFYGRPAESDTIPEGWCEEGAPIPYALLEASRDGFRVIHPSLGGQLARLAASLGVGFGLGFGIIIGSLFVLFRGGAPSMGAIGVWFAVVFLLITGLGIPLGIFARKLGGWRPLSTGIRITVREVMPGIIRHELRVEGGGDQVWLTTVALRRTLLAAIHLADEHPAVEAR